MAKMIYSSINLFRDMMANKLTINLKVRQKAIKPITNYCLYRS